MQRDRTRKTGPEHCNSVGQNNSSNNGNWERKDDERYMVQGRCTLLSIIRNISSPNLMNAAYSAAQPSAMRESGAIVIACGGCVGPHMCLCGCVYMCAHCCWGVYYLLLYRSSTAAQGPDVISRNRRQRSYMLTHTQSVLSFHIGCDLLIAKSETLNNNFNLLLFSLSPTPSLSHTRSFATPAHYNSPSGRWPPTPPPTLSYGSSGLDKVGRPPSILFIYFFILSIYVCHSPLSLSIQRCSLVRFSGALPHATTSNSSGGGGSSLSLLTHLF